MILVTTKKGEIGKPKINYNGYVGLQNITRYPEYYNGYEYATLYNEAQQNIGVSAPIRLKIWNVSNKGLEQLIGMMRSFEKQLPLPTTI